MLILTEGKEIPALKRALPIFEDILTKKGLYMFPPSILGQIPSQSQSRDNSIEDAYVSPHTQVDVAVSQMEQHEDHLSFDADFVGFDFLDEWQIGQLNFTG